MTDKILYSPDEVADLSGRENVLIIDIRDGDDYGEDHISGAVNVPDEFFYLAETTPEGLDDMHRKFQDEFSRVGLTADTTAIIYEDAFDSRYGGSCRGYWLLKYLDHEKVGILDGGFDAWRAAGLPVDAEEPDIASSDFQVTPDSAIIANRYEVEDALSDESIKLLDNRDKVEWIGVSSSPYGVDFAPRKGRLAGAKWIEWYDFMERDGQIPYFKSPEKIRQMCAENGFHPDDDIIIYCFKGARAANTYVALKEAGFSKVRNYFGSWNEWSRDPALPALENVIE